MGKKSTPAPKVTSPRTGSSTCETLAGPMRFEQMRTVTKAAITNS